MSIAITSMREGSLEAPTRHPIPWQEEVFYDLKDLDQELRKVFDICHTCRRCYNLCDSFPKLFDLIDAAPTEELDSVDSKDFKPVIDACTLCDMCFMTKCPYVPPHEWNLDFPHLMLRAKAIEFRNGERKNIDKELAEIDRNGKLMSMAAPVINAVNKVGSPLRPVVQALTGIDSRAEVPPFAYTPLTTRGLEFPKANPDAAAYGQRKVVLYSTCFCEFNTPDVGIAAAKVLAYNGVEVTVDYPGCCGMPKLENGDLPGVAAQARKVAAAFERWIDDGYDIVALTPSCALMLKFEWPLILPDDPLVKKLSKATFDTPEYVMMLSKAHGLLPVPEGLEGGIAVHFACHSRAQNFGPKAMEMLKLIPNTPVTLIERCSGHGGKWGMYKENFDTAIKVGKYAGRDVVKSKAAHVVSECPLAGPHIKQIIETLPDAKAPERVGHPIELMAKAYGL
jgi:glycerol-3-phosphate dehydrogenase subunit C